MKLVGCLRCQKSARYTRHVQGSCRHLTLSLPVSLIRDTAKLQPLAWQGLVGLRLHCESARAETVDDGWNVRA
jgi:hypothetical protein